MYTEKILRETIINHPDGTCTLGEIQLDVNAWNGMQTESDFGFTSKTVQSLINKIIEQQQVIESLKQLLVNH